MPSLLSWVFFAVIIIITSSKSLSRPLFVHTTFSSQNYVSYSVTFLCGAVFIPLVKRLVATSIRANTKDGAEKSSLYGLDHGRLHLKLPDSMWMNMGYWKDKNEFDECLTPPKTLAEACRDLLIEVFATAGIDRNRPTYEGQVSVKKPTCVIDLGFGCGDQTACLMGTMDSRKTPRAEILYTGEFGVYFKNYVGLTLDKKQYQLAVERIRPSSPEFSVHHKSRNLEKDVKIDMFCADAGRPELWSAELTACVQRAAERSQVRWVLALDTAYHFSPSRWPLIQYACRTLNASFAAFDLCLSPTATFRQKLLLRVLTTLMGAPWANFVNPDEYRTKLIEVGYDASSITIRDVSEHVFGPLAAFLEKQDRDLRVIGLGIGPFNVARLMFAWWARSGVVRGVIVVAKQRDD